MLWCRRWQGPCCSGAPEPTPTGAYTLPPLLPGSHVIRATKAGYQGRAFTTDALSPGQAETVNFQLDPLPNPPAVEQGSVAPPARDDAFYGELKLWQGGAWVSGQTPDPSKTTLILTHGWNSDPEQWASGMAARIEARLGNGVNITAWDWQDAADTGIQLSKATARVPSVGEALGRRLAAVFPGGSRPRLHFIGHSLGTLVNAKAADYLHETASPPFDWQQTHVTLLDNAVLANVEGQVVNWQTEGPGGVVVDILENGVNWQTPDQAAWVDNYISLVGMPSFKAINVFLALTPHYADWLAWNPVTAVSRLHGYSYDWYGKTIQTPGGSQLGFRYTFENLGTSPAWPTPNPYRQGTLLEQNSTSDELSLAPVLSLSDESLADYIRRRVRSGSYAFVQSVVVGGGGYVLARGDAIVTSVEEGWDSVKELFGIRLTLTTKSAPAAPGPAPGLAAAALVPTNTPALASVPVTVPANAVTLTFDYALTGDGGNDSFVFGINGSNLLEIETRHLPQGQPVASGPIDVTAWNGQTVELFFGVVGGTSTNASITVQNLHFNFLTPVELQIAKAGNVVTLSWPVTAAGYQLESTAELGAAASWTAVTNAPGIAGFEQVFTNVLTGTNQFFRLRQQ